MITINKLPGQRVLELGGGEARNPASDVNIDIRPIQSTVDIQHDLENVIPWPIQSGEFDAVLAQFFLEHVSFTRLPAVLAEILRVLKPGGRLAALTPNTQAQQQWIVGHPDGWDNKPFFESASELLYGSQRYGNAGSFDASNVHKSFFSPQSMTDLLRQAGFGRVTISPFNDRQTDMAIEAEKPAVEDLTAAIAQREQEVAAKLAGPDAENYIRSDYIRDQEMNGVPFTVAHANQGQALRDLQKDPMPAADPHPELSGLTRKEMFDRHYFGGGGKVGGYAREGYRDFPCHYITVQHILNRKPDSVLEIGASRGYLLKRLQDTGLKAHGLEISRHCYQTRICDGITEHDCCETPWPGASTDGTPPYDLAFSIATFEHLPEQFLPGVLGELKRFTKRGLHGIDFGGQDDGFDKTHCTLRDHAFWRNLFDAYGLQSHEIVDKESLEGGLPIPDIVLKGDGKRKLNVGSFTEMTHYGWLNIDIHDLAGFAQANGYQYLRHDVRAGLPFKTGEVDLLFCHHMLEHLSYKDGLTFLRECRRVLKPTGAMRLAVPDAEFLMQCYMDATMNFDEMNEECAQSKTDLGKLWTLLMSGHAAAYDWDTLRIALADAGFTASQADLHKAASDHEGSRQIIRETNEMAYGGISLFVDALPEVG